MRSARLKHRVDTGSGIGSLIEITNGQKYVIVIDGDFHPFAGFRGRTMGEKIVDRVRDTALKTCFVSLEQQLALGRDVDRSDNCSQVLILS